MKLATFRRAGATSLGIVDAEAQTLFDLTAAAPADARFASMLALIDAGDGAVAAAAKIKATCPTAGALTYRLAEVALLPPLPDPRQIRDFSVFPAHIKQSPAGMRKLAARAQGAAAETIAAIAPLDDVPPVYKAQPIYYKCNRLSLIGHDGVVRWPRYSKVMDFELEIALVVGRGGVDIRREDALSHAFGYTIFNDFSARDAQMVEMQGSLGPAKGKDFDTGNAFGPWIVTADELPDPIVLNMEVKVNGESWSRGRMADMLHRFEDMIAFVSRDETLHPGEILCSGTMNNGCGLEMDRYLQHGDRIELNADRIGTLANTVMRQDV